MSIGAEILEERPRRDLHVVPEGVEPGELIDGVYVGVDLGGTALTGALGASSSGETIDVAPDEPSAKDLTDVESEEADVLEEAFGVDAHTQPISTGIDLTGSVIAPLANQGAGSGTPKTSSGGGSSSSSGGGRSRGYDTDDIVRIYLAEIGTVPLLTKADEIELAKALEAADAAKARLEAGGEPLSVADKRLLKRDVMRGAAAEKKFIEANLRLVVSIAKKYQGNNLDLLDVIQEGNIGLIHAVGKFDWRKGFKFSTYATWWIRHAITRGIANTGRTIRLPVHFNDNLKRVNKARIRLEKKTGKPPTLEALAAELDMTHDKLLEFLDCARVELSFDAPISGNDDSDALFGDFIADPRSDDGYGQAENRVMMSNIDRLLAPLNEREKQVLKLRFGVEDDRPRTLEEVGREFGVTRERIRQIEAKALATLRHPGAEIGGQKEDYLS